MWSTREVADLAGTTLRAVRHYHDIGLLEEPRRRTNGYKEYDVPHLLRVVRITRLTELGFSLDQIAAMPDDGHHPPEALRALEARLTEQLEALERSRAQVRTLLDRQVDVSLPPDLAAAPGATTISDADRAFIVVMSRVLGPAGLRAWQAFLTSPPEHPAATEFDELPADADEATRRDVAERLVAYVDLLHATHPALQHDDADAPRGPAFARRAAVAAVHALYNEAQRDVLVRVRELRQGS